MTPAEVRAAVDEGAVVLDLRPPRPFAAGHLPGAINIQFNRADLADRAAMVLPADARYVVHAEPDPIAVIAAKILGEAGFTVLGYLEGGLRAWHESRLPVERLPVIGVDELHDRRGEYEVVDAREGYEYRHAHIASALLLPSGEAWAKAPLLTADRPLAIVCGDQVRSSLVASILLRSGKPAVLVFGGMVDWLDRGYEVEKAAPAASANT